MSKTFKVHRVGEDHVVLSSQSIHLHLKLDEQILRLACAVCHETMVCGRRPYSFCPDCLKFGLRPSDDWSRLDLVFTDATDPLTSTLILDELRRRIRHLQSTRNVTAAKQRKRRERAERKAERQPYDHSTRMEIVRQARMAQRARWDNV